MQLGVRNDEAAKLAEAAGLKVVMNRCPKIEYGRLSSEIAWMGVNTRTLSSKKAQLFGRGIQRMALNRATLAGGRPTPRRARSSRTKTSGRPVRQTSVRPTYHRYRWRGSPVGTAPNALTPPGASINQRPDPRTVRSRQHEDRP